MWASLSKLLMYLQRSFIRCKISPKLLRGRETKRIQDVTRTSQLKERMHSEYKNLNVPTEDIPQPQVSGGWEYMLVKFHKTFTMFLFTEAHREGYPTAV